MTDDDMEMTTDLVTGEQHLGPKPKPKPEPEYALDLHMTYDVTSGMFRIETSTNASFMANRSEFPDRVSRLLELVQRGTILCAARAKGIKTEELSTQEVAELIRAYKGPITRHVPPSKATPPASGLTLEDLGL